MDTSNLADVIRESIEDIELPADTLEAEPAQVEETPAQPEEVKTEEPAVEAAPTELATDEVKSPAAKQVDTKPVVDSFEKKYGIPALSASGRPNRIPHDRVVKIVGKAQREAVEGYKKEWEPKYKALETENTTYKGQLSQVAQFEQVMANEPARFLDDVLAKIPAYKPFFDKVRDLLARDQAGTLATPEAPKEAVITDDMPQPDRQLADGTSVYSMEGLSKLNAWNRIQAAKQAREEVMKEVEKDYGPIRERFAAQQKIEAAIPAVQAQINEARTWSQFNENEAEIIAALKANERLSLEGAYRQVVFPKLAVDRNKVREEVLKEIKATPRSTSTSTSSTKAASSATTAGPRSLTDVINDSIKNLPGR